MDLEILRTEHQRLLARYETIVDSSFADFSLLAALASIPAVLPAADWLGSNNSELRNNLRLAGFVMALVIVVAVALRDLLKWCIAEPYLQRCVEIECRLRAKKSEGDDASTDIATRIVGNRRADYLPQLRLFGCFGAFALGAPLAVFGCSADYRGLTIYGAAFVISVGWYLAAAHRLGRRLIESSHD